MLKKVLKRWAFDYNGGMIWLRKGIVHLLALVLLVSLLSMAAITALNHDFANPNRLESWLAKSKLYGQIIPNALGNAQVASSQDGSEGSISLNDPGVQQAATQAFSPTLLQQNVSAFLNGNYAWLKGQTATPVFKIDLSSSKQSFANQVGQLVQSHLAGVPVCTATQLTQLQLPVDPLTVSCRPLTLDPKTESQQVEQAITGTGDFLNKPVITAANLSQGRPYYQRAAKAPQLFRLALKLPYILGGVALVAALGIVFIAPKRRKGWRRVGATLLVAGAILVAVKFVADTLVNKFEGRVLTTTFNNQLKQPYHDLLHNIESSLTQTGLWFGVAFLVLAVIIFICLIATRSRGSRPAPVQTPAPTRPVEPADTAGAPLGPADIQLAPRQPQLTSTAPTLSPKKPRPPKRPRLILISGGTLGSGTFHLF